MQIGFDKIGSTPKQVTLEIETVVLEASLVQKTREIVTLDGKIHGNLPIVCDRCGANFDLEVEQKLDLNLTNKVSQNKDDLDIIEFLDGVIDIEYIIQSEINSLKSAYHYCKECEGVENFEIEI
ncbi:MAG TPA: hypothetical protein ENN12_04480 [Epsilonproteobacteria bacterium]|nr:hypothetical protein [Campylobacterota bacterium]